MSIAMMKPPQVVVRYHGARLLRDVTRGVATGLPMIKSEAARTDLIPACPFPIHRCYPSWPALASAIT